MKKVFSTIISAALTLGILSSSIVVGAVQSPKAGNLQRGAGISNDMSNVSVESTNSFGNLLSNTIDEKLDEQKENNGFNVFSVEMLKNNNKISNIADVTLEAINNCTLVIGIYDEEGKRLLASGNIDIKKGDKSARVKIDIKNMPEYFYIKAYLVDTKTFRPLCTVYESPNYTKEMQEFFAKTTDDFNSEKVLNLDGNKKNNFAVYDENTKLISSSKNKNKVLSIDDKKKEYIIGNIDNSIKSLKKGDIFAYDYNSNDVLIVKIADIKISGTKAIITGEDAEMDEVFDYVKIDGSSDASKMEYDSSGCDEDIVCKDETINQQRNLHKVFSAGNLITGNNFLEIPNTFRMMKLSLDVGGEVSASKSFEFEKEVKAADNHVSGKISGSLEFEVGASIKLYISFRKQYLEVKLDYSANLSASVSGNLSTKISLGHWRFIIVSGLLIAVKPTFIAESEATMEVSGTLEGSVGFNVSRKGIKNITTTPEFESEMKVEGKVYIGVSLEPEIDIVSEKIAKASIEAKVGVELSASMSKDLLAGKSSEKHECGDKCIKGEINAKLSLAFKAKLLNLKKLSFKLDIASLNLKLTDFYYSLKFNDFGFDTCPHLSYRITALVADQNDNPIKDAKLKVNDKEYTTDAIGKALFYLPESFKRYTISASKQGYSKNIYSLKVDKEEKKITINLYKNGSSNNEGNTGGENPGIQTEKELSVKSLSVGSFFSHSAAITEDGDLYTWGYNNWGQLGIGKFGGDDIPPTKVKGLSNVVAVSCGSVTTGAVTKNGDLYMWGSNSSGQLGDGTTERSCIPKKVNLRNVASVSCGSGITAAITKNGDLYTWGSDEGGRLGGGTKTQIGNATYRYRLVPEKIMSNIASVNCKGSYITAITKDGELYVWGYGIRGDQVLRYGYTPQKIMSNIASATSGRNIMGAVTKDGDLYMWGSNSNGLLGDGKTIDYSYIPQKVKLNNVDSFMIADTEAVGAVTKNGELYMWGKNRFGQLGDGTTNDSYIPQKIKLNNVASVSGGDCTTGAVTKDGNVYMWGRNHSGALGDGSHYNSYTPKKVRITVPITSTTSSRNVNTTRTLSLESSVSAGTKNVFTPKTATLSNTERAVGTSNNMSIDTTKKEFTSLTPNETYNFYLMKSKTANNALGSDNLLYITQETADSNGNLTVKYDTDKKFDKAEYFIVAKSLIDISKAKVKLNNVAATGKEQFVKPIVTLGNETLVEGRDYELSGDYSVKNIGKYTLKINGIGLYEGTITHKYNVICDYNLTPLVNNSTISSTTITLGQSIKLTAKVAGGTPSYKYTYSYKGAGDKNYTELSTATTAMTFTHKPTKVMKYSYAVKVTDAKGKIKTKYFNVNVVKSLVNNSTINKTSINLGETVKLTAKATGGKAPYKYYYSYKAPESTKYVAMNTSETVTERSTKPLKNGTYFYSIKVVDANGAAKTKSFTVNVVKPLINNSTISKTSITLGETVKLTAKATNGRAPYKYYYSYKSPSSKKYVSINASQTSTVCSVKPTVNGTYSYSVKIVDANGVTKTKSFAVNVVKPLVNNSTISKTSITLGETVKLTAKATNGRAPYKYYYSYKSPSSKKYVSINASQTSTVCSVKPTVNGTYSYSVKIVDANGNVKTKYFSVSVIKPLVNNSTISTKTVTKGKTITFTGKASGGTSPYQYKFSQKHSTASSYTVLKNYNTTSTKVWKPTKTGKYTVLLQVKDKTGKIVDKTYTLTVK